MNDGHKWTQKRTDILMSVDRIKKFYNFYRQAISRSFICPFVIRHFGADGDSLVAVVRIRTNNSD